MGERESAFIQKRCLGVAAVCRGIKGYLSARGQERMAVTGRWEIVRGSVM